MEDQKTGQLTAADTVQAIGSGNTSSKPSKIVGSAKGFQIVSGEGTSKRGAFQFNKWVGLAAFIVIFGGIGSYLLFASHADTLSTNGRIYYNSGYNVAPDGSGKTQNSVLASLTGYDWTFSPKGNQLASSQPDATDTTNSYRNLVIADSDGSNQKTILSHIPIFEDGGHVAWSPDGQWIAFGVSTVNTDPTTGAVTTGYPFSVGLVHPDGSDYHTVASLSFDQYHGFSGVSWLNDSNSLAFISAEDGLCTVEADGTNQQCHSLPTLPGNYSYNPDYGYTNPQVSPDGKLVLLTVQDNTGNTDTLNIYEANIDGTNVHQITSLDPGSGHQASSPTWSPDGALFAFGENGPQDTAGLYVANADGSNIHKIDSAQGFAISWQTKQPTDPRTSAYYNGSVIAGSSVAITSDGSSTGSPSHAVYDSISWTGKQYANFYRTTQATTLQVGSLNDLGSVQPKSYPIPENANYLAWSRNPSSSTDQQIAYSVVLPGVSQKGLQVMNAATGAITDYGTVSSDIPGALTGLDWSEDNGAIYYALYNSGGPQTPATLTLCSYSISSHEATCDTQHQIVLAGSSSNNSSADLSQVVWSPDGSRIAYAYKGQIFVANQDGSTPLQVSSYTYANQYTKVVWSPDGLSLLYTAPAATSGKYLINQVNIASKTTSLFYNLSSTSVNSGGWLLYQPILASPKDTTIPTVTNLTSSLSSPITPQSNFSVCVQASDDVGVAKIALYDNEKFIEDVAVTNSPVNNPQCLSAPVSQLAYGTNAISVRAYDFSGNVGVATVTKTIQLTLTALVPTISGTVKTGSTLTANPGTWTSGTTLKYQWYANGTAISGATAQSLVVPGTSYNKQVTVKVTGSQTNYAATTTTSKGTALVAVGTLTAPVPTITGTSKVDSTLTANPGTWTSGTTLKYQWYANGTAISGATAKTYKVAASLNGKTVSVHVTGSQTGYTTATKSSAATTKVAPGTLVAPTPTISGTPKVGIVLTANPGTWTTGTAFQYQWYANGAAISGATGKIYRLVGSLSGKSLTVRVTGSKTNYTTLAKASAATAKVAVGTLTAPVPTISGTLKVDNTLTANPGAWTAGTTFQYQWYANGTAIGGATGKTYKLVGSLSGKTISVHVAGSQTGYTAVTKSSAATAKIALGSLSLAAQTPAISGVLAVGKTLTAYPIKGRDTPNGVNLNPITIQYQWYANKVAISKATGSTYTLASAVKGKTITLNVTYSETGYTTVSKTSTATPKIQ